MRVYKFSVAGSSPVAFRDPHMVVEEVEVLLEELAVGDTVSIRVEEIDEEKFQSLPEFEGY